MDLDRLKGIFLGSTLRILGTVILGVVLLVAVGFLVGVFGIPSVEAVENRFGGVNETTTVIETDVVVNNPNPIGLKLGGSTLNYAVAMNDIEMAAGSYGPVGVGAGNSTMNFTSYMDNTRIPDWWVSHVRNGEYTSVTVDATVQASILPMSVAAPEIQQDVNTDITAAFNTTETRPIDANQPFVSDPVLYLNETSGNWGEVTAQATDVEMTFTVYNPKSYPISASEIGYDMSMNSIAIGEGATASSVTIPPGETRDIETTTTIRNERLDDWWVTHLERNQRTNLTIDFYARFDFSELGGGTIQIPLDTMESQFETDIFGTKEQTDTGNGGTGNETSTRTGTDTATPTEGSATATPTDDGGLVDGTATQTDEPTSTEGSTPTPTATETDDGLLG